MEYAAHLIPEGGFHSMPKIVGNGVVVVGDAGQMVNGVHREGSNMAMTSGRLAAEAIILAKEANDFSENMLDTYRIRLLDSFVGQDLKKYKDATHTFETYPQYFKEYIPMINKAASQFFTVDGVPKKEKQKKIFKSLTEGKSKLGMVQDIYRAWKVMK
jgi:electron transfer flavoprotein-quinone oxidoreductase